MSVEQKIKASALTEGQKMLANCQLEKPAIIKSITADLNKGKVIDGVTLADINAALAGIETAKAEIKAEEAAIEEQRLAEMAAWKVEHKAYLQGFTQAELQSYIVDHILDNTRTNGRINWSGLPVGCTVTGFAADIIKSIEITRVHNGGVFVSNKQAEIIAKSLIADKMVCAYFGLPM